MCTYSLLATVRKKKLERTHFLFPVCIPRINVYNYAYDKAVIH